MNRSYQQAPMQVRNGTWFLGRSLLLLLFADDIMLLSHTPPHMQHLLGCLESFCDTDLLTVNVGKTKVLKLCTSRVSSLPTNNIKHFQYKGNHIANVDEFKYLGLWFDQCASL